MKLFKNRKLLIATKHRKETVIAPILERELGVHCFVSTSIDTDLFGTFTGETERVDDAYSTARKKCILGMETAHCDLAVASEGSFGVHPAIPFLPADDELILFIDRKNDIEIVSRVLSTETNFAGREVCTFDDLISFADRVHFPTHGLIIKSTKSNFIDVKKGITDFAELKSIFECFQNKYGSVFVETDMRALYNPTRMKVIGEATNKLVNNIQSLCPSCEMPGFEVVDLVDGLPCSQCGLPTKSIWKHIFRCKKCHFSSVKEFPRGKRKEDPMYCDYCNP